MGIAGMVAYWKFQYHCYMTSIMAIGSVCGALDGTDAHNRMLKHNMKALTTWQGMDDLTKQRLGRR